MGKMMEAVFCAAYLLGTGWLGVSMLRTARGASRGQRRLFGALTLVLVGGDAFHLLPRIYGAVTGRTAEIYAALGFGTLITSLTMTVFYALLWLFWQRRTGKKQSAATFAVCALSLCRLALCLFPQNDWFSPAPPLTWGIYRNIPFALLGGIVALRLWREGRAEPRFRRAWLAVALSFLFYLPVVLFSDSVPMLGMLMIPKTVCYVWLVVMGDKATASA